MAAEEGSGATKEDLIERPREYTVKFSFPAPPPISGVIVDMTDVWFRYWPDKPWLLQVRRSPGVRAPRCATRACQGRRRRAAPHAAGHVLGH